MFSVLPPSTNRHVYPQQWISMVQTYYGQPGSIDNCPRSGFHVALIAQLGERQTEDLKVAGSRSTRHHHVKPNAAFVQCSIARLEAEHLTMLKFLFVSSQDRNENLTFSGVCTGILFKSEMHSACDHRTSLYSSVGRARDCSLLREPNAPSQYSCGRWFESGWRDTFFCSLGQ